MHRTVPVGDHEVVTGAVEMVRIGEGVPLVHHDRTMRLLADCHPGGALVPVDAAAARHHEERG
ncbi:hypothetical protein [Streptomyces coeruleorubidus]|uniref:Uncharacterized protein n=1 Tax=Streptomyces coeruleorubidus TaxID=116188 RepID=A0A5J6HWS2_STRC4|nr:hypothetical protein [Streptomyces coeruleorubidus]QEV22790.1 hypothetical protein CP976_00270 [Streptomyces coeruleorubidus]GGU03030.1 hypothetical protein GCM10010256_73890 [Streptomyces coeruleorubidus]